MSNQNTSEKQHRGQALKDAENHIKQACEILQQAASKVRQEEEDGIVSVSENLDQVHSSRVVKLNVGGIPFTTTVTTLRKDPNSMLAALFSGTLEIKPSEDGSFFIDRDGTYFRHILNYLRDGELILPGRAEFLKELEAEARFYRLQGILDALKPKLFVGSVILTNKEHRRILKGWLPEGLVGEWRLLFRASRDGFAVAKFHTRCDNKGPTITIVKSEGNIFGGFIGTSFVSGEIAKTRFN